MRRVYRIENADGVGPYLTGAARQIANAYRLDWYSRESGHPGPYEDPRLAAIIRGRRRVTLGHFGFTSKRALKRWFRNVRAREALGRLGYRVVVYEVAERDILRGTFQVVFNRARAVRVATIEPHCV